MDPSPTAISKSSVIPIEHTVRPRASTIRRSAAKAARVAGTAPAVGPIVINPSTRRPAAAAASTIASASPGSQPDFDASPVVFT